MGKVSVSLGGSFVDTMTQAFEPARQTIRDDHIKHVLILAAAIVTLLLAVFAAIPYAIDWSMYFRPAAHALLNGQSPYDVPGFFNPPWALFPLLPLALLPEPLGRALLFGLSTISLMIIVRRFGANLWSTVAFMLSLPVMFGLYNGNIDWLAMLGFIMPPPIGMLFVTIKPQIGMAVVIFWLFEAWQQNRWWGVTKTILPTIVVVLISFLVWGFWPLEMLNARADNDAFNTLVWPWSIPLGIFLLIQGLRKHSMPTVIPASLCLSPYAMFHSWAAALLAFSRHPKIMVTVSIATWSVPFVLKAILWD